MTEYPLIEIAVSVGSWSITADALPDTGYDGAVILPKRVGDEIMTAAERGALSMADGYRVAVDTWEGELMLEGTAFAVPVHAFGDEFIIGREVLDQLEICFCFGREVRLRFTE